jgi:endonuclease/exonuclease/phosphatase family metal-dependent hydrolase
VDARQSHEEASGGAARVPLSAITWNLFHGRDFPPDPSLFTLRSRLLRVTEDNGEYVQVNRSLEREYATLLASARWCICLVQEVPPSWAKTLARSSAAWAFRVLTSRNALQPLTSVVARSNPDLIASWEGGSNLILVRGRWRPVAGSARSLLLNPLPGRDLRERRRMSFVRLRHADGAQLCVANLHAGTGARAERDLLRAAGTAVEWAGDAPLLVGGDFNLRPRATRAYDLLERELGLGGATAADSIDHLLSRGLETVSPPRAWPPQRRDLTIVTARGPRRIRLSDHSPVEGDFGVPLA